MNRDSSGSLVTSSRLEDRGLIPSGDRESFLVTMTKPVLSPRTGYRGLFSGPKREADNWLPPSAEIWNEWISTSTHTRLYGRIHK
jgi:hypothetical protein